MRSAYFAVALAACYSPSYRDCDITCPSGTCPSGLDCVLGVCREPGAAGTCGSVRDDAALDAPPDMIDAPLGAFSTPQPLSELNVSSNDQDPALTDDLLHIVFSSDRPGGQGASDLYEATRTSVMSPFGGPVLLLGLNSPAADSHPWLSPDGLEIWFVSARLSSQAIFRATRATRTSAWSNPMPVPELDSVENEHALSLTTDRTLVVLDSSRNLPPNRDLFIATRSSPSGTFSALMPVPGLSTDTRDESSPAIVGIDFLYFVYDSATPNETIYRARREGLAFDTPERLDELFPSSDPWVRQDNRTIVFSRPVVGGGLDLFIATR